VFRPACTCTSQWA